MNTTEGNKLIAEFMGASGKRRLAHEFQDAHGLPKKDYNTSWDWLMPVVKEVKLSASGEDRYYEILDRIDNALMEVDIDYTYKHVVDFIDHYNKTIQHEKV